jgi:F0F1-type ATP synthase membrane subunit c/vacuolar-type H+-ATPase subunit K
MINYIVAATVTLVPALGVSFGQGKAASSSLLAITIQPALKKEINRAMLLGLGLIETASVLGLLISVIIIKNYNFSILSAISIILLSFLNFLFGFKSTEPVVESCLAIARQPFLQNNIIKMMLLSITFLLTPVIFSFVISLIIKYQSINNLSQDLKLLAAAISLTLGSIGSIISMAKLNSNVCYMIGYNRRSFKKLFRFALISQAMIETPILLSLIVSLIIININSASIANGIIIIAAGLCTGICCLVSGLESGKIAAQGAIEIGKNPNLSSQISNTSMLSQGLLDTFAVYGLIISILMLIKQ